MKSKLQIIKTYDAIAEDFDITRYKPWPTTIEFAGRFEKGALVLDLGCGNGRDMRLFSSAGAQVVGMDISAKQLKVVRQRAGSAPMLVRGDVASLPFREGIADGAVLAATLHHLPFPGERLKALAEAHRCLAKDGLCLVGVWAREQPKFEENFLYAKENLGNEWEPGDMLLDWKLPDGRVFKRYYHMFSEEEFDGLLEASLFIIERRWFSCDNHYAVLKKV